MIKTAIIAKPIEPPLIKTPFDNIPWSSSRAKPIAANKPISHIVLMVLVVLFIIYPPLVLPRSGAVDAKKHPLSQIRLAPKNNHSEVPPICKLNIKTNQILNNLIYYLART